MFTYNLAAADAQEVLISKVRLEIGDTTEASALFTDDEVKAKLGDHGENVALAAAALCDILARRFAREFDFSTDGQSFSRSQKSKQYAQLARDLRGRAQGATTVSTRRDDGYSQDVDFGAVGTARTGRVRRGYTDPDLPA
ncbi:MAG TPA: hypothetical protein VEW67_04030 [Thermoleophilaceae bacterium]|nr:hypothetical protein [Thermoleophilaceae bacterium]